MINTFIELAFGSKAYFIKSSNTLEFKGFSNYNRAELCYGLSNTIRFNGGIPYPYTVAMHSINGAQVIKHLRDIFNHDDMIEMSDTEIHIKELTDLQLREAQMCFLIHDMCEALVGDIPSPIKTKAQSDLEDNITLQILKEEGIDYYTNYLDITHLIDKLIGYTEAKQFGKQVSNWNVTKEVEENYDYVQDFDLLSSSDVDMYQYTILLENRILNS